MKRYLFAGLFAVATPPLADAHASLPVIGWSVSQGHSATGSKICTLFGGFGEHSAIAWVADSASPPQHLTLVFDDGGVRPRSQTVESQLMIGTYRSSPLAIPGTIRFGQFKASLTKQTLEPFLHLFAHRGSMTVALEGETPVSLSLKGSAAAAQGLQRCEMVENIPQQFKATVRVATARHHHSHVRLARAAPSASVSSTIVSKPLPDATTPVATTMPPPVPAPAPAPVVAPAALQSSVVAPAPLPASVPPPLPTPAPSPTPAPAPAAQMAMDDMLMIAKAIEDQFVDILQDGKASYENSNDQSLSAGARANRAGDLCALLGNAKDANDWTGTVSDVSSGDEGRAVLVVKLADGVTVGTMNGSSSGTADAASIEPASDLFKTVSQLHVGEHVLFSGHFFPSDADCIKVTSPTEDGAMISPNFIMKFNSVAEQH